MDSSYETFSTLLKENWFTFSLYFLVLFLSLWGNYSIYVTVIFGIFIIFKNKVFKYMDITSLCLFLFSFIYSYFYMPNMTSWTNFISYLLCPTAFYLFGKYSIDKLRSANNIIKFWCLSILSFSIILYISTFIDISQNGFVNIARSFTIYGTRNYASVSATLYGITASLGLVGLPYFFVKQDSNIVRYAYLLFSLLSLITVIHLVNRTGLVVIVVCFAVTILYIFQNRLPSLIFIYAFTVFAFVLLIHFNIIDKSIIEAYQNRDVDSGSVDSAGGRTNLWNLAINNLIKYPFGWLDTGVAYSHNLWLDIARVSGIMPFTIFLVISIRTYIKLFRLLITKEKTVVSLLIGLHLCFFLTSFVEPIIEAIPLYFYLYMMLWGMQNMLIIQNLDLGYTSFEDTL